MCKVSNKPAKRSQGSKWITRSKRLALYLRDGFACAFCGGTIEDGCTLTLDHLVPYSEGGSNDASNLVTSCRRCNSARGARNLFDFCDAAAGYLNHGVTGEIILSSINKKKIAKDWKPFHTQAKEIIASRPDWQSAINACN